MKKFRVGTFYDGRHFSAYTLWYNTDWGGCIEYEVEASNGTEAKKIALKLRREAEAQRTKEAKHAIPNAES